MKDERFWDYSDCQIGHPCNICEIKCTFHRVVDVEKKENEYERITEESKE